ncbi:MAG: hypothetical protein LBV04_02855 [Deferribacteraceae bacterium]|jgi:hypothetical protein|nr:hypothetical protein [Deferribacteraceae bacterium]
MILRYFVALIFLFCTICAYAETSPEDRKAEAQLHMQAANYQAAYDIYATLLWEIPDDDEVNIGLARAAMGIGRYYPALMALERLSVKYPRDMAIRKELLLAYLRVDDFASARREAEILKQNGVNIDLGNILPDSMALSYSGRIAIGLMYDSNTNSGLDHNPLPAGYTLQGMDEVASMGAYLQGTLNTARKLSQSSWLVSDLNAYYRYNNDSELINNIDVLWLRAAAGWRLATKQFMSDLRIKVDLTEQGSKDAQNQRIFGYGLDANFAYSFDQRVTLGMRLSADKRDYNTVESREGTYWSIGEYVRVSLTQPAGLNLAQKLTLNLRLRGAYTDLAAYDYLGWEASLSWLFAIDSIEITPLVAYGIDSYDGLAIFIDKENRRDKQLRAAASAIWRFHEDWSAELFYQYSKNNSNSLLYSYDQHLINMSIAVFF